MPYKEEVPDIQRWLQSRIDILDRDFSLSPVERLCKYYIYNGQPVQFHGFEWQIQIVNDTHPRQVIQKRSQVGLTTCMMWKVVLFLEQYSFTPFYYTSGTEGEGAELSLFPTAIYTLENDDKVREFSADRLRGLIKDNPYLEGLLEEGEVDQISLKKFGRAALYLGGRKTVSAVTTIPAQMVLADEWDRTTEIDVGEQLEARLKASPMFRAKTQRGMFILFSTPEMENWGVTKTYEELSDQMVWCIKCTRCGHWQEMLYPDSIGNYYEKGKIAQGEPFYQCLKCKRQLDFAEIGQWNRNHPHKITNAEWVPKKKEYYDAVTSYGEGYRGYKVPWAYSTTPLEVLTDRDRKSVLYFHHHVLGIPYEDKKSGMTSEVMNSMKRADLSFGYDSSRVHVMGVDQGAYITIWQLIPLSRGDLLPMGRWRVVHAEFCPDADAFKTFVRAPNGTVVPKPGRLAMLMDQWKIAMCVVDAEPSGNDALNFQRDFIGRVFINHSSKVNVDDPTIGFNWFEKETDPAGEEIFVGKISEDKTQALDAYFDFLYSGNLELPLHEEEIETVIKHHLGVKRTTTEKKMSWGRIKYETLYYAVGADHYAQAGKFAYQAAAIYFRLFGQGPSLILVSGQISGVKMFQKK